MNSTQETQHQLSSILWTYPTSQGRHTTRVNAVRLFWHSLILYSWTPYSCAHCRQQYYQYWNILYFVLMITKTSILLKYFTYFIMKSPLCQIHLQI